MRKSTVLLAALAASFLATAAAGSVSVLGSSPARKCFEAADTENGSRSALSACNAALMDTTLTQHEVVATYVNRGIVRMHGKDDAGALVDFDLAIARDGNEAEAYLNKAVLLLKNDESGERALPLFDTAIRKGTSRPEIAYFGRAVAHEAQGDIEAAYRDYRMAAEIAPEWPDPQRELTRFSISPRPGKGARGAMM